MRFLKASALMSIMLLNALLLLSVFSMRAFPGHSGPRGGDLPEVRPGDLNCDGEIDLSDCLALLTWLYLDDKAVPCAIAQTGATLEDVNERLDGILEAIVAQRQDPCKSVASRFLDNGDGTFTDSCTGLMWQETPSTYDIDLNGSPDYEFNYNQAVQVANLDETAGYNDWRIPTFEEYEEIVTFLAGLPYKFVVLPRPRIQFGYQAIFWTSNEIQHWGPMVALLEPGKFNFYATSSGSKHRVWLVRGE